MIHKLKYIGDKTIPTKQSEMPEDERVIDILKNGVEKPKTLGEMIIDDMGEAIKREIDADMLAITKNLNENSETDK